MVRVNKYGYLTRRVSKGVDRNWWLVKYAHGEDRGNSGSISLCGPSITMPKELVGKKVRFKVEVLDERKKVV